MAYSCQAEHFVLLSATPRWICFLTRWRRRTRLARNQCCRQLYPTTIKPFACDQAQEHAGGYSSHFEKRLAHAGETRTDDGRQLDIVKTDHAHAFRHVNVAQVERFICTHRLQVISGK